MRSYTVYGRNNNIDVESILANAYSLIAVELYFKKRSVETVH